MFNLHLAVESGWPLNDEQHSKLVTLLRKDGLDVDGLRELEEKFGDKPNWGKHVIGLLKSRSWLAFTALLLSAGPLLAVAVLITVTMGK